MGQLMRRAAVRQTVQLTTDAGNAYASGDVIDSPKKLSGAVLDDSGRGILNSVLVRGETGNAKDLQLWYFKSDPGSVGNDNAAFSPTWAALQDCVALVLLTASTDGSDAGSTSAWVLSKGDLNRVVLAESGEDSLWLVVVAGAGITFTGDDDLEVDTDVLQL